MSNATTVAQARAEFIADLKRLRPAREAFTVELEQQAQKLAEKAHKRRQISVDAANAFLASNSAFETAVEAELAAQGE